MAKRKNKKPVERSFIKRALVASLLLHALVFLSVSFKGCGSAGGDGDGKGKGSSAQQEDKGEIIEKIGEKPEDKVVEIQLVPADSIPIPKPPEPKREAPKPQAKKDGFGGIGVEYSGLDGTIGRVPVGYPAWRAGIQPGDQIISPAINEIRGEPGTKIELAIRRGNTIHYITLVREFIETSGVKNGNLQDKEQK
jgi:hypothetical protein